MKKTFGLPYMGSKNETAENLVSMFPRGRRLLDLFGGGASVTHASTASLNRSYITISIHLWWI